MKRTLAFFAALIMVLTALSGALAEISYDGSAPLSDEPIRLSVLTNASGSRLTSWDGMEWLKEALRRINVDLDMELVDPGVYKDVLQPRLAAGIDLPDIVCLAANDTDLTWSNSGLFVDLSDMIDQYGFNLNKRFAEPDYADQKKTIYTPDGEVYFLPSFNPSWSIRGLMINMPWLRQLDLKVPETMDEFHDVLLAFKQNDMNGNGDPDDEIPLFMRSGMTELFGMFWGLDLLEGWEADENGVVTCSYIQPQYYDFLQYFHTLYEEGLLFNEFATASLDMQNSFFADNQIGSIVHFLTNLSGYSPKIDPNFVVGQDDLIMQVIPAPAGPYGHRVYYGNTSLGSVRFGITTNCKNPEAAFCFLDWLYSDEATNLMWFGIEGKDYTVDENGNKVFSEEYLVNANGYRNSMGYNLRALPDVKNNETILTGEPAQMDEMYAIAVPYLKMPTFQFSYSLPDEIDVVSNYSADLKTYFKEMFTSFITGVTPLNEEEFAKYVSNVKALHVDDMTAIYQAKYDRAH